MCVYWLLYIAGVVVCVCTGYCILQVCVCVCVYNSVLMTIILSSPLVYSLLLCMYVLSAAKSRKSPKKRTKQ